MPLHYRAWVDALAEAGDPFPYTEAAFYAMGGMPTLKIAEEIILKNGSMLNPKEVRERKEARFLELLPTVAAIEPVLEWVRRGRSKGIAMAVASGGSRPVVLKSLEGIGMSDWFRWIVTPEQVTHGKPSPEIFLLAAQKLRIAPSECLVFEDSETGFQAAKAAGMAYVAVPQPHQR